MANLSLVVNKNRFFNSTFVKGMTHKINHSVP